MNLRKALAISAVALSAACGSSSSTPTTPSNSSTPPAPRAVNIPVGARTLGSSAYVPNPLTISPGTTVTWTNADTIPHTTTSNTAGVFDSGTMAAGATFSFTFANRGTFDYHCTFHPGMVASVVVQ